MNISNQKENFILQRGFVMHIAICQIMFAGAPGLGHGWTPMRLVQNFIQSQIYFHFETLTLIPLSDIIPKATTV